MDDLMIPLVLVGGVVLLLAYVLRGLFAPAQEADASRPVVAPVREPADIVAEPPGEPPLFDVRGVWKEYLSAAERVVALHDVHITIGHGMTGIVGPSGGGKTTALNCLGGLDRPDAGHVRFKGRGIPYDDERLMRRYRAFKVAWVFQELNLIGHQTVLDNVALPLLCHGVPGDEARRVALENLELLNMGDYTRRHPDALSRGQKQRVAIARAFTSRADVILADEPTGSLDSVNAEKAMEAFKRLSQVRGKSIVLVTHQRELADRYCDRILLCEDGRLREAPPRLESPQSPPPRSVPRRQGVGSNGTQGVISEAKPRRGDGLLPGTDRSSTHPES